MPSLSLSSPPMIPLAMLQCLEGLEPDIHRHGGRVGHYACLIGEVMGFSGPDLSSLELAARLHDIGKLFVPSFLVHKRAVFDLEERRIMQRHTMLGARLLEDCPGTGDLALVARHHHDRWDGCGYPSHLAGRAIPLPARITAVADAYDAMTSDRPGGNRSHDVAVGEILRCGGAHFCPETVEAFLLTESRLRIPMAS